MQLIRLPRAIDLDGIDTDVQNWEVTWGKEYVKPVGKLGTQWINVQSVEGYFNTFTESQMGDVGIIFWACVLNLCLSLLPILLNCCRKCCGDEKSKNKKSAIAGSSNSFISLLIGVLGVLAVKYDCKELLITVVIMAGISLLLTAIYLLISLCGFCIHCRDADGCCDRIWAVLGLVLEVVWIVLAFVLDVVIVLKAWPFCFQGDEFSETVGNLEN